MKSRSLFALTSVIHLAFLSASPASAAIVYEWASGFQWPGGNGMNDVVFRLLAGDIGSGPALYAGGFFTNASVVSANHIAQWNGANWSVLGSGLNSSPQ